MSQPVQCISDWAVTRPHHVYRFRPSNTRPPADALLDKALRLTPDVALVVPPLLDSRELEELPVHELQEIYLGESHELFCIFFGSLAHSPGLTELHV